MRRFFVLAWVLSALSTTEAAQAAPPGPPTPTAAEDAVYAYTDDRGALVHAQRLDDIPPRLRAFATRVDVPAPQPKGSSFPWLSRVLPATDPQPVAVEPIMYRYRTAGGREVYTNLAESIPIAQRAVARIDLRDVSLNTELGTAIDHQLEQRFQTLQRASSCSELRAQERAPWLQRWTEQGWQALGEQRPLVLCGGALLVLIALTPWMLRQGWGGAWARVLKTATPLLAFVGLSAFLLLRVQSSSARHARAERCEPAAWHKATGLPQRFQLVHSLEAEQQRAMAQLEAASRP